jgi:hypothetical protein
MPHSVSVTLDFTSRNTIVCSNKQYRRVALHLRDDVEFSGGSVCLGIVDVAQCVITALVTYTTVQISSRILLISAYDSYRFWR